MHELDIDVVGNLIITYIKRIIIFIIKYSLCLIFIIPNILVYIYIRLTNKKFFNMYRDMGVVKDIFDFLLFKTFYIDVIIPVLEYKCSRCCNIIEKPYTFKIIWRTINSKGFNGVNIGKDVCGFCN